MENIDDLQKNKDTHLHFKVTKEQHDRWKSASKQNGMFFYEFLTRAIDEQVKKQEFRKLLVK